MAFLIDPLTSFWSTIATNSAAIISFAVGLISGAFIGFSIHAWLTKHKIPIKEYDFECPKNIGKYKPCQLRRDYKIVGYGCLYQYQTIFGNRCVFGGKCPPNPKEIVNYYAHLG